MNNVSAIVEFQQHAARAFFASAWAEAEEDAGQAQPGEIMSRIPAVIDTAAWSAARTLLMDMELRNKKTMTEMIQIVQSQGNGDRPNTVEFFGHYAAMQAMGHGVGLADAFGEAVREQVQVPYVEFGMHSLSKDYF